MDLIMRPRQGGKTYELVQFLVDEPEAILICADRSRVDALERTVREVLLDKYDADIRPAGSKPRRVTKEAVQLVMDRVILAGQHQGVHGGRPLKGRVLVDGIESVLERLLGFGVDKATLDVPVRQFFEFSLHFDDERVQRAWERERNYRDEQRRINVRGALYGAGVVSSPNTFLQGSAASIGEALAGLANNPNVAGTAANRECLEGCGRDDNHLAPAECAGTMVVEL